MLGRLKQTRPVAVDPFEHRGLLEIKQVCTCGNPSMGFECVCEWVTNHPGNNTYSCEYCGLYEASDPRCNKCEEEELAK